MAMEETGGRFNRTEYMRAYMRERRAAEKPETSGARRRVKWQARALELRLVAGTMGGPARAMMERLAEDYERLALEVLPPPPDLTRGADPGGEA
jgi:hypothetical protein